METALVELVACEALIALDAVELNHTGKELPEEVPPRNFLGPQTQDKFVELEAFISDVRSLQLAVSIYENLTFFTDLPSALRLSKQGRAMGTPLEHVLVVLEQDFEFFHENFALQLVFLVFEAIKDVNLHFAGKSLDESRVHAVHVDWQEQDFLQIGRNIVKTFLDESRHLEEVRADEDRDGSLNLHGWLQTVHILHEPVKD